ncbi:alpha/beta fold hydrolase [Flavobacteriaceae bacterium]|nr:alpha/beta fold hydrolase [Flavobacteriaceae bacterium]MDA9015885.1 alpha/beta fold hydrolase [Flavobacteriaceae bacterium]MDB3861968.1 alpha/beta fold hydrolase [Flavobacteriaceae bacterium]
MLEYRIQNATSSDKENTPAIILIHGYGSNADDLFSFAPYLPKNHTIIAIQAPLTLSPNSYAWYPLQMDPSGAITSELEAAWSAVQLIVDNINELVKIHKLDAADISLLGFSQGAILSWAIAYHHSDNIRRIVALSGMVHESVNTSEAPNFLAYSSHGINDQVIPISQPRNTIVPLSKQYNQISYHEYNDGHTVSQENFNQFVTWLEKTNL